MYHTGSQLILIPTLYAVDENSSFRLRSRKRVTVPGVWLLMNSG